MECAVRFFGVARPSSEAIRGGGFWYKEKALISNYNNDPLFRFLEDEEGGVRFNCRGEPIGGNGAGSAAARNDCMTGRSLAMVYSPCQEFEGLYEPMAGLLAGTVFRELEKPFYGARRLK